MRVAALASSFACRVQGRGTGWKCRGAVLECMRLGGAEGNVGVAGEREIWAD